MADRPHRPWALWLQLPLVLTGIAVSVYMSRHHETQLYGGAEYQDEALVGCAEAEGVSCDIVNTSAWSELLGVPLFTWAIPAYVLIAVLAVLAARGEHKHKPTLVALGLGASLFSGFLYYISVVELGYVCLWCMRLYGINAAVLVLSAISGITRDDLPGSKQLLTAAGVFVGTAALAITGQQAYRATLLGGTPRVEIAATPKESDPGEKDPTGTPAGVSFAVTTEDGTPANVAYAPGDAWKGNPNAKIAVIEFADFECGYCKRTGFELRRLYEKYKDDVLFVFKHFPMNPKCNSGVNNMKHVDACNAAAASVCAQEQGSFWAMHDMMFKNNHQLKAEHILAYVEKLGLNEEQFRQCMVEERGLAKVKANAEEGKAAAIHGTPRIWIQGELYRAGQSAEQLAAAIERALGKSAGDAAQAAQAMREAGGDRPTALPPNLPEMQRIAHGGAKPFFIDTFESALTDGKATTGVHQVPATRMSWFAAADACEAGGKRMCSEEEWITACQAEAAVDDDGDRQYADDLIEGTAYPYGDFHEPGRCWENKQNPPPGSPQPPNGPWRPVYTGEMPACVSPDGVYDLAGNVEEWAGRTPETAILLGGAFDTPDDKARCYRRNDTFGAGYANQRTGFRCCKDAE